MILAGTAALLMLSLGTSAQRPPAPPQRNSVSMRRQQIIIRVPSGIRRIAPAGTSLIQWRERTGRAASPRASRRRNLFRQESVDLILRNNSRIRARLNRRCPALDYYRGFYINATEDGRVCADRDTIRSRAGGESPIDQFRTLTPERLERR